MTKELAKSFILYHNAKASTAILPATAIISLSEQNMPMAETAVRNTNPELRAGFDKVIELRKQGYTSHPVRRKYIM